MPKILTKKVSIPIVVLLGFILMMYLITSNSPEVIRKRSSTAPLLSVETQILEAKTYKIRLPSYGTVEPRTRGELISQVGGKVDYISDSFRAGGFFEKDELLLKIDPADFEVELQSAKALLVSAQQAMLEEQARADVATQDWNRVGNTFSASALALRKPQLRASQANVDSAKATVAKAELNYHRTSIRAPYAGRVLNKHADIGQVITTNKVLANIYAIDFVEIRLPIKNQDLRFVDLPENYRRQETSNRAPVSVQIFSKLVADQQWQGVLVRTEGAIDSNSQQLHAIAKIDDPYGVKSLKRQPLKIGQYVTAIIQGRELQNALVIPNLSIYHGSYVYVVVDDLLQRREINISWQNDDDAIVDSGLKAGDALVLTALGQVTSGTRVKIAGSSEPSSSAIPRQVDPHTAKRNDGWRKGK